MSSPSIPTPSRATFRNLVVSLAGLVSAVLWCAPARATVGQVTYLGTYASGSTVNVWRRTTNSLHITGSLLDLCTGVEVQKSGTTVSNPTATITARSGGSNTFVNVDLTCNGSTALGDYKLLIHYAVEASGPDVVPFHVYDMGVILGSGFTQNGAPVAGSVKVGTRLGFQFQGSGLGNAIYHILSQPELNRNFQEGSHVDNLYSASFLADRVGDLQIAGAFVADRTLPDASMALLPGSPPSYNPSFVASSLIEVVPDPQLFPTTPTLVDAGATVVLTGRNLTTQSYSPLPNIVPSTYAGQFTFQDHSLQLTSKITTTTRSLAPPPVVASVLGSQLTLNAPENYVPGSGKWVITETGVIPGQSPQTGVIGTFVAPAPLFYVRPSHAPTVDAVTVGGQALSSNDLTTTFPLTADQIQHVINNKSSFVMTSHFTNTPADPTGAAALGIAPLGFKLGTIALQATQHQFGAANTTQLAAITSTSPFTAKFSATNLAGTGTGSADFSYVPAPSGAALNPPTITATPGTVVHVNGTNVGACAFGGPLLTHLLFTDATGFTRSVPGVSSDCTNNGSVGFAIPAGIPAGAVHDLQVKHYGGLTPVQGTLAIAQ